MRLFRSMTEAADGMPAVGPAARLLGVRPGSSVTPDVFAIQPDASLETPQADQPWWNGIGFGMVYRDG
jgi:hypothetical protein